MTTETALPVADVSAEASAAATADLAAVDQSSEIDAKPEGEVEKPQKTAEERELERARRKIDRLVRQREELRAQVGRTQQTESTQPARQEPNTRTQDENEPLTLSRAELQQLIKQEATKLAPAIKQQEAEIEHRAEIVKGLAKEWGQAKFDSLASDLDEAFGGLADDKGRPKPATDAIFESDAPKALIEYLADPENADEAEAIGRMGAVQAGRAVAKLEIKLAQKKAEAKPQPSKAAAPIEAVKGGGTVNNMPDPSNTKAYIKWANEQERRR